MGGIWAEVLADVSRVALPCSRAAIESAIRALRGVPVLLGHAVSQVWISNGSSTPSSSGARVSCWAARWSSRC
jgi:hypothetical protein